MWCDARWLSPREILAITAKEEWIAYNVDAKKVDALARRQTRGRFFVAVSQRRASGAGQNLSGLPTSSLGLPTC
jgi:hypothetical protein